MQEAVSDSSRSLYRPLVDTQTGDADDENSWPIRLLTLSPGTETSRIKCHLSHSTIGESKGKFDAVSYAWGDLKDTTTIRCDGSETLVTRSVATALRCLRHKTQPQRFWIDALCIDQSNVAEKSALVPRMWAIFTHARRVTVFLGDEYEDSDVAMRLLDTIASLTLKDISALREWARDLEQRDSWEALLKLMKRLWWRRAWVVQEYVVAKEVQFICGQSEITGDEFSRALQTLSEFRFKGDVPPDFAPMLRHIAYTPIRHMWSTRKDYQSGKQARQEASHVLYKFRGHGATDPRDKVFSFYRLLKEDPLLKPDYSLTTAEVYKAVVRSAIKRSNGLEILSHHNRGVESNLKLPSWCPDWTVMRGRRMLLWPNHYRADAGSAAHSQFDGDSLILSGMRVGRVRVLARFPSETFDMENPLRRELEDLEKTVMNLPRDSIAPEEVLTNLRLTIVAGRLQKGGPQHGSTPLNRRDVNDYWEAWLKATGSDNGMSSTLNRGRVYNEALFSALCGRAVCVSDQCTLAIVDGTVLDGDEIWILKGGRVPLCLHPREMIPGENQARRQYELVGECYLDDWMDGSNFSDATRDEAGFVECIVT